MNVWHAQAADAKTRGDSKDVHPLGLLLFGDSVDFRFVKYFCQSALGQEPSAFTVFDSGSEWLKLQGEKLVHSFALCLSVYSQQCHMFPGTAQAARRSQNDCWHGVDAAILTV